MSSYSLLTDPKLFTTSSYKSAAAALPISTTSTPCCTTISLESLTLLSTIPNPLSPTVFASSSDKSVDAASVDSMESFAHGYYVAVIVSVSVVCAILVCIACGLLQYRHRRGIGLSVHKRRNSLDMVRSDVEQRCTLELRQVSSPVSMPNNTARVEIEGERAEAAERLGTLHQYETPTGLCEFSLPHPTDPRSPRPTITCLTNVVPEFNALSHPTATSGPPPAYEASLALSLLVPAPDMVDCARHLRCRPRYLRSIL
ncbi:uncharacterized protein FIBRA_08254 [Fibroporia radiculosa]|uniref:Uncharacterized protein n=1 Tax=Fibroporia radiculosa TaxID=599839 RepID=J4IC93_9APHY|nr:uncharacterized protein FIBRA_08254 [Fibroporia radiculosa]CCM06011.1 predicted protein [Fibroporia radiculosa]